MTQVQKKDNNIISQFDKVLLAIDKAKSRVYSNINKELISLYWDIGKYISEKVEKKLWGKSIVENLADYIQQKQPNLKGYSRRNLWRMKQFYEAYNGYEFLSTPSREIKNTEQNKALTTHNKKLPTVLAQISWSHNVEIFSRCKLEEERGIYVKYKMPCNSLISSVYNILFLIR